MYGQQPPTWSSQQPAGGYGGAQGGGYPADVYVPPPMEEKGTALKVFGILGASFGGLNLLYNVYSIIQGVLQMRQFERMTTQTTSGPGPGGGPSPFGALNMSEFFEANLKITISHGIAMMVMDVAIIAIGVLLIQRKEIGRKLAIAWAGLAIIVLIGRALSIELWLMPHLDKFMGSMSKGVSENGFPNSTVFSAVARVATYIGLAILAIWPITLLVAMNLQSVKRGIQQKIIRQAGW